MVNVSQTGGSVLDTIVDTIIPPDIVAFLNTVLYKSSFILLNYWSFVHLFSGVTFYFLFPKRFTVWIWINILFEITEYLLGFGGNPLFVEETIDIMFDIVWSLGGFLAAKYLRENLWVKLRHKET